MPHACCDYWIARACPSYTSIHRCSSHILRDAAGDDAVGQGSQGLGGYRGDAQPYEGQPAAVTTRLSRTQIEDSLGRLFAGDLCKHGNHWPMSILLPANNCLEIIDLWSCAGCARITPSSPTSSVCDETWAVCPMCTHQCRSGSICARLQAQPCTCSTHALHEQSSLLCLTCTIKQKQWDERDSDAIRGWPTKMV